MYVISTQARRAWAKAIDRGSGGRNPFAVEAANDNETDNQTVVLGKAMVLGVSLEHEVFVKLDGSFMFLARLPAAPAELTIGNGWLVI